MQAARGHLSNALSWLAGARGWFPASYSLSAAPTRAGITAKCEWLRAAAARPEATLLPRCPKAQQLLHPSSNNLPE